MMFAAIIACFFLIFSCAQLIFYNMEVFKIFSFFLLGVLCAGVVIDYILYFIFFPWLYSRKYDRIFRQTNRAADTLPANQEE